MCGNLTINHISDRIKVYRGKFLQLSTPDPKSGCSPSGYLAQRKSLSACGEA
jgi:hypothetical protein